MAVAPAVDQVGGAGGAQPGIIEVLEDRAPVLGQVREVHVVDGVGERAEDPVDAGGAEGRAVLHVALLATVVPVHGRDQVLVGAQSGGDGRRGHGGDRGKGGHTLVHVRAAGHDRLRCRGTRPSATASCSAAGSRASITVRTTFRLVVKGGSPQDPQARVLAVVLTTTADQQQRERHERQERHGRDEDGNRGEDECGRVRIDGEQRRGVPPLAAARRGRAVPIQPRRRPARTAPRPRGPATPRDRPRRGTRRKAGLRGSRQSPP